MNPSNLGNQRITFPRVVGILSGLLGLFVLVGWAYGISWIKSVLPGAEEMKADTAVGLLLSGIALCLLDAPPSRCRWMGQMLALIVAALGLATMSEYAFGWRLGIDEFLFRDTADADNVIRSRMALYSTVAFAVIGLGLLALHARPLRWFVWLAAILTILIGGVSLIGCVPSARELVTDRIAPLIAVNTAIAFAMLGIGTFIASFPLVERRRFRLASLSSVEIKTLAGFLGALLLLLLVGGQTYWASVEAARAARWVAHTQQVRAHLGRLYAAVSDAESQQLNHLLSAKPAYLENFNRHAGEAVQRAKDLAGLIADNPAQVHRMKELQVLIGQRLALLELTRSTFDQPGLTAAQEEITSGEGSQLMAAIRDSIKRMNTVEESLLKTRSAHSANDESKTMLSLLVTLAVASAGFVVLYSGVRRELTSRTNAEAALRRSEESLAVTLHSIGDAVLATDPAKRVTWMNSVAEKLTGSTEAEARGLPISDVFNIINEETRQPALIPVDSVLATGKTQGLANHTIVIARDGAERPIAASAAPIRDKSGRIFGVVLVFRDVTEEREAEQALRDSETLTRAVLDSMMANIAVVDRRGTIIAINEGWVRFARENNADATWPGLGVGADYLEVCRRTARDLGEEALEILDGIQGVLAHSRDAFKYEYPCHSPTEQRWLSMHVTPLSRADGGAVIAHMDVTERKQAEQVLADFKAALDEHAIVATTDAKGEITYVNDRFCSISRYARDELLGENPRIISSGDHSKSFFRELWETITSGRVWKGEIKNRAKDGAIYWVNTSIVPFLGADGKPVQFIAIQADVTERRQAQDELDEFFNLSLDFLGIANADGYFKRVSPAVTAMLGWSKEEFLSRPFIDFVHPEDHAATLRVLEKQVVGGENVWSFENRYRHKDGSWRVLAWKSVRHHGGLMYATARDVTEFRHTEERIRRLNADLQSRAAQTEAANEELEAFSYSVSHDLRAPLRHIHGYVDMLTKATEGQLSGKAVRYLEVIGKASEEMGQLIDHLLAFSRMGRAGMQEGSVDLNQLVQQTLQGLETATRDRNIVWKIAPLPPATGDRAMLRQVFANLIGNAVKYSSPRDPAEIEIGCAGEENGRHIYFVRDNGAGFDMRYAHKLFGVFQRLHTAEEFEGTGIGLATVRRILTRHGDRIWAESESDRGTTFYFTLKAGVGIEPPTEPDNKP